MGNECKELTYRTYFTNNSCMNSSINNYNDADGGNDDEHTWQAIDLQSVAIGGEGTGVLVQDTDLSYRPRATYTQWKEEGAGWWQVCVGKTPL